MKIARIYKITNSINGKSYIGFTIKTIEQRFKQHLLDSKRRHTKLYSSIKKYGAENFNIEEIYCSQDIEHTLKTMEAYFIRVYNSFSKGYNHTLGGEGGCGRIPGKITRLKMSVAHKGVKHVQETKDKISKAHKNAPRPPELRNRIREGVNNYIASLSEKERKELFGKHKLEKYKVIYSSGKEIDVSNLKEFCKTNDVYYDSLVANRKLCKANIKELRGPLE